MPLITLLGVITLFMRERRLKNAQPEEEEDQDDVPPVRISDGREIDDWGENPSLVKPNGQSEQLSQEKPTIDKDEEPPLEEPYALLVCNSTRSSSLSELYSSSSYCSSSQEIDDWGEEPPLEEPANNQDEEPVNGQTEPLQEEPDVPSVCNSTRSTVSSEFYSSSSHYDSYQELNGWGEDSSLEEPVNGQTEPPQEEPYVPPVCNSTRYRSFSAHHSSSRRHGRSREINDWSESSSLEELSDGQIEEQSHEEPANAQSKEPSLEEPGDENTQPQVESADDQDEKPPLEEPDDGQKELTQKEPVDGKREPPQEEPADDRMRARRVFILRILLSNPQCVLRTLKKS